MLPNDLYAYRGASVIESPIPDDDIGHDIPDWFTNEPDPVPVDSQKGFWRPLITAGALLVILVLLLIPVLQAEILQRRREELPDAAFDRTALQFASAVLFGRSEGQAMLFASDDAENQIQGVIDTLINRPNPSSRARLQIQSTPCAESAVDACYLGRIFDPNRPIQIAIRFGLNDSERGPLVEWVEFATTTI